MFKQLRERKILSRILILKNKTFTVNATMQATHLSMLEQGFYFNLNEVIDQLCYQIRMNVELDTPVMVQKVIPDKEAKLAYYQKILSTTIKNHTFITSIVYSQSSGVRIWYPLKKSWLEPFKDLGLKFNQPVCSLLMFMHELLTSIKSIIRVFEYEKYARCNWSARQRVCNFEEAKTQVFLFGFARENFPTSNLRTHNFLEWLENYLGTNTVFAHNCKQLSDAYPKSSRLKFQKSILDSLNSKSLYQVLFGFLALCSSIILNPKLKSLQFLYVVDELLISQRIIEEARTISLSFVFFPSSFLVIKPLWATTLENLGVKVICVHYSASAEPRDPKHERVVSGIWHLSNWANSWVVDQEQINQMNSTSELSSKEYKVVGVPHWSGKQFVPTKELKKPFLSVFDTYINDPSFLNSGTIDFMGWNDYKLEFIFIEIILECASELGFTVLHKKKRKITKFSRLPELRFAEFKAKLESKYGALYQQLDEDYSAHSLIELSHAVVSKPFSTTAILAKQLGVPSFFLDPTGRISAEDPGLRECGLARTKTDLKALLQTALT